MTEVMHEAPPPGGTPAPELDLPTGPDASVGLGDLRHRPAVLATSPADRSAVCSDQMVRYQEIRPMLHDFNARILGDSVDGVRCHRAFARHRGIEHPLLSDPDGAVRWSVLSPIDVNPGADGILRALEDLTGREARA